MLSTRMTTSSAARLERVALHRLLWGGLLAAIVAVVVTTVVRTVMVTRFGITAEFRPLRTEVVAFATVLGVLVTIVLFALLDRFVRRPIHQVGSVAAAGLLLLVLVETGWIIISAMPDTNLHGIGTLILLQLLTVMISVGLLTLLAQDAKGVADPTTGTSGPISPQTKKGDNDTEVQSIAHTILLVAHDSMLVQSLQRVLAQAGYPILVTNDAGRALDMLQIQSPSLVVIERRLLDVDGLDLCRRLRRQADVRIMMVVPSAAMNDTVTALEHGADDVISSLCSPLEFVARVRAILRRSSP